MHSYLGNIHTYRKEQQTSYVSPLYTTHIAPPSSHPGGHGRSRSALASTAPVEAAQPHMQAALRALNNASEQLNAAEPDKAGHREKAIGLVRDAIGQVQEGIRAGR
ncbi:MAG TPA: hypothetical protein VH325_04070 [Bryobacteraceae bacterium]|nr:hypothetical protein [Bryobacteraceae bacterium]